MKRTLMDDIFMFCHADVIFYKSSNDWIVLLTASKWYKELLHNWLYWYNQLSLDMKIVLIAEDEFIYNQYINNTSMDVLAIDMSKVKNFSTIILCRYVNFINDELLKRTMIYKDQIWISKNQGLGIW